MLSVVGLWAGGPLLGAPKDMLGLLFLGARRYQEYVWGPWNYNKVTGLP
jgi:hypothetical protein